jgi:hypothetical protein
MYYELETLLNRDNDLGGLEVPFSKEEIDVVIAYLPNNKSPRPDGFNGEF